MQGRNHLFLFWPIIFDYILFCMAQFIFYKTYRAIELGRI